MGTPEWPEMASTVPVSGVNMGRVFLTVDEAAERLGVKRSWIYERTRRNTIPHRRLGKFVRFTEQDIRAISEAAAVGDIH
jgi:excisionase family DNA binding protein